MSDVKRFCIESCLQLYTQRTSAINNNSLKKNVSNSNNWKNSSPVPSSSCIHALLNKNPKTAHSTITAKIQMVGNQYAHAAVSALILQMKVNGFFSSSQWSALKNVNHWMECGINVMQRKLTRVNYDDELDELEECHNCGNNNELKEVKENVCQLSYVKDT